MDGCVIAKDFTTLETLEQARQEVEPWLAQEDKRSEVGGKQTASHITYEVFN